MESLYYANTRIGSLCISQGVQYKMWECVFHLCEQGCLHVYRYQVIYQVGVLIARSSVFVVRIRFFSVLSILQVSYWTSVVVRVLLCFVLGYQFHFVVPGSGLPVHSIILDHSGSDTVRRTAGRSCLRECILLHLKTGETRVLKIVHVILSFEW